MSTDAQTELVDQAELEARAAEFETAPAGKVIAWAVERFGSSVSLACSFQDCVIVDLAVQVDPAIEVLFLDTGFHFPETLAYRRGRPGALRPEPPGHSPRAPRPTRGPCGTERCCEMRKVVPLDRALGSRGVDDRAQARATPPPGRRRPSCRGTTPVVW